MQRCAWVTQDPLYLAYHDDEWGVALTSSQALFELLCLESQQAGLSWFTVLKKRQDYRLAFHHFDAKRISEMDEEAISRIMLQHNVIRHRAKLNAIVTNARAFLAMEAQGEDFSRFIWQFVNHQPRINHYSCPQQVPARTAQSDAMAKALKKKGFSFVGAVTCYAFMQAAGLVNDHLTYCPSHPENNKKDSPSIKI